MNLDAPLCTTRDNYREYETVEEEESSGVTLVRGNPPTSYSGWHLVSGFFSIGGSLSSVQNESLIIDMCTTYCFGFLF